MPTEAKESRSRDPYGDVRQLLAKELGREVRQDAWSYLSVSCGPLVDAVRHDRARYLPQVRRSYEIYDQMHPMPDIGYSKEKRSHKRTLDDEVEKPADLRELALAKLAAARLERQLWRSPLADVFRQQELGGKLLEPQDIPRWVESRLQEEGQPSRPAPYMPIPTLNQGSSAWQDLLFKPLSRQTFAAFLHDLAQVVETCPDQDLQMPQLVGSDPLALSYCAPGGSVLSAPIRADGVLARLKNAVSGMLGLCKITGWQEHEAVAFLRWLGAAAATPSSDYPPLQPPALLPWQDHDRPGPPRAA